MFRKAILPLSAVVAMAAMAPKANANIDIELTVVVSQPAVISGTSVTGGTWAVFATVQGSTPTLGLGGFQVDVTGDGNVSVYSDSSHKTKNDAPSSPETDDNDNSIPVGFEFKKSTGTNGIGIAGFQDNSSYQLVEGADAANDQTSILSGVGLTAGSQTSVNGGTNSWSFPVKLADGFYQGTSGHVIVTGNIANFDALPSSLPTLTLDNETGQFTMLNVDSINNNNDSSSIPGTGNFAAAVGVPEPASLGMLALGGLALLARRRKSA